VVAAGPILWGFAAGCKGATLPRTPFDRRTPQPRSDGLQRFFSTFPGGWPGVGLLLLRAVVGATTAAQGGFHLANVPAPTVANWAFALIAIASGTSLVAGFMTPGAGVIAAVVTLSIALDWSPPASVLLLDTASALLVVVDAAAVVLLGPGAHSMDAFLFGRREILIPHEPHPR
jgi:uncharacterized membrane protein YphA (DoxX/SURF4 family)